MRIVEPSWEIEDCTPDAIARIERVARTCYRSEGMISAGTAARLVRKLVKRGHFPMFDHAYASARIVCDRGVTHELVRHRIGVGYAQESTRFCNYGNETKHPDGLAFVRPLFWPEADSRFHHWVKAMRAAEDYYLSLLADGATPQEARSVLPNSLRTEIVVTGTFTFWRHLFDLRTAKDAHPQMRQIMVPLLAEFVRRWPEAFEDLTRPSLLDRARNILERARGQLFLHADLQGEVDEFLRDAA
jgi:thymidylate synthase (FAD)